MGLDKDDPTPPVDFKKRTSKVNVFMVLAVVLFLVIAGVVVFSLHKDPTKSTSEAVPLPH
jgi:hypothetical protein